MDNELKSLGAVEMEIRARYNGKYQSTSEYQASERATRKAITDIFGAVADFGTCDDVLTLISDKEYRRIIGHMDKLKSEYKSHKI